MRHILIILCIFVCAHGALAASYPERQGNLDVIFTDDTFVDLATKVWMIDHAQKSIDISAFILGKDSYGLSIVRALHRALERGVQVRMMYEGTVSQSAGKDLFLDAAKILVDSSLRNPAKILSMRMADKLKSKLALNDYLHEKLVIIDADTENEIIYTGGRDLSDFSRKTIDSGYFMRPVDYKKESVLTDIKDYYNKLWNLLSAEFPLDEISADEALAANRKLSEIKLERVPLGDSRRRYFEIIQKLDTFPKNGEELAAFQFRPESVRMVTNDLLETVLTGKASSQLSVREVLSRQDEIAHSIVDLIKGARDVQVTAYTADFTPILHDGFKDYLKSGRLKVITNGWDAMNELDPVGVSELSYEFSLRSIQDLGGRHLGNRNFRAVVLDYEKALSESDGVMAYLHRKLALVDHQLVITGSYNFTSSSSSKNDEFILVFNDARMNRQHRELTKKELDKMYKVHQDKWHDGLYFMKNTLKRGLLESFVKSQY